MSHLEAATGFRTNFIYDDIMFALAGCVAEVIGACHVCVPGSTKPETVFL